MSQLALCTVALYSESAPGRFRAVANWTSPKQLQPLPRGRISRRAPKLEGGQENRRRAPWRVGPALRKVVGEWDPAAHASPSRRDTDGLSLMEQNGKMGEVKNLNEANVAATKEAASA